MTIISTARLLDKKEFTIKKTKETRSNLSIDYIKSKVDIELMKFFDDFFIRNKDFISSIKHVRDRFLVHHDI